MTNKPSVWRELGRRNVYRVGLAYLASAWLLVQVADTVLSNFGAPTWIIQALIGATAIGLPIVLIVTWLYELTPDGVQRDEALETGHPVKFDRRTVDWAIIGTLVLAVGFLLARDLVRDAEDDRSLADQASIAVLPFLDLSPQQNEDYFSNGIAAELIGLLATVPDFRVTSRSSSFSFRDSAVDVPTIAERLNVDHVLEGSVQRIGDRVRIGVQLIDARSDTQVWSDIFDRNLRDIFAVQNEIAMSVLDQLQVALLDELPAAASIDPMAYSLYLQAHHILDERLEQSYPAAEVALREALEIDPDYVTAIVELGRLYWSRGRRGHIPPEEGARLARQYVQQALSIDADSAVANAWAGYLASQIDDDIATRVRFIERALEVDPRNTEILGNNGSFIGTFASLDDAIRVGEFAVTRDPMCDDCAYLLARNYRDAGRFDDAVATLRSASALRPDRPVHYALGESFLLMGNPAAALAEFQQIDPVNGASAVNRASGLALATYDLGDLDAYESALAELERLDDGHLAVAKVYAYVGNADAAFSAINAHIEGRRQGFPRVISRDIMFSKLHDDPRWDQLLYRMGVAPEQLEALDFRVTLPE